MNPEIAKLLLPIQRDHAKRLVSILKRERVGLDLSDMGTGKTYSYIATAKELALKPLIVCPATARFSVERVCDVFRFTPYDIISYDKLRRGGGCIDRVDKQHGKKIRTSYRFHESVRSVIFDEIHMCKGASSLNSKLVLAAKDCKLTTLGVSGTLATSPLEMRAIGYLLSLYHQKSEFGNWLFRNKCKRGKWGFVYYGGQRQMDIINREIIPRFAARLSIDDMKDSFPENRIIPQCYTDDEAKGKLNQAIYSLEHRIKELKLMADSDNMLTNTIRERQAIELTKTGLLTSLCMQSLEENYSVAIFVNFRETMDILSKNLNCEHLIHGDNSPEDRQRFVDDFNADRTHVIILMLQAGGQSISLHGDATKRLRASYISPSFSATMLKQCLWRTCRVGGRPAIQNLVFVAGTKEEKAYDRVNAKLSNLEALNDNDLLCIDL